MSDQAVTVDQTADVTSAVLAAQMSIIDAAVRASRDNGWCGEFESVMGRLFPHGPPDGSREFVDSDGLSCRGVDREGYRNGYDRDGYDRQGYDSNERDREGRDRDGYDYSDRDREGRDRDGYDATGFNRDGVHRDGYTRDSDEYRARFRFNRYGYDREGYDRRGLDPWGLTREQRDNPDLYLYDSTEAGLWDAAGVGADGYDRQGALANRERRGY